MDACLWAGLTLPAARRALAAASTVPGGAPAMAAGLPLQALLGGTGTQGLSGLRTRWRWQETWWCPPSLSPPFLSRRMNGGSVVKFGKYPTSSRSSRFTRRMMMTCVWC
ncbi:MAG: hypothetical protein WDW38_009171 [Sanguina aurantia]